MHCTKNSRKNFQVSLLISEVFRGCPRLRNELYCVEWDVKLYYTVPYLQRLLKNQTAVQILRVEERIQLAYSVVGVFSGSAKSQLRRAGKLCMHLEDRTFNTSECAVTYEISVAGSSSYRTLNGRQIF